MARKQPTKAAPKVAAQPKKPPRTMPAKRSGRRGY